MLSASQIFDGIFINYNTIILYITVSRYYKSNLFIKPFGTMLSFRNSQELKDRLLDVLYRIRWDSKFGTELVESGFSMSKEYGIARQFGLLCVGLGNNIDGYESDDFDIKVFEQIPVGKDLSLVPLKFIRTVLAPYQLVMPNLEPSETLYYFECRQKIRERFLELAKMCDKLLEGQLVPSEELEAVNEYLAQFGNDPMCRMGVHGLGLMKYFNTENDVIVDSEYTERCQEFVEYGLYLWKHFNVKNSSLWFRNLLFSLVR